MDSIANYLPMQAAKSPLSILVNVRQICNFNLEYGRALIHDCGALLSFSLSLSVCFAWRKTAYPSDEYVDLADFA